MENGSDSPPSTKPPSSGGRRLPGRTPSGLLGKPGTLQLNQSTTPQQQALPVKRRGSFQQLKKAGSHVGRDGASSHLDSDSSPSIFAVVKKSTHWEKYGTVLVLVVADEFSSDKEAVLQMLSAEGYDDNTTDNIAEAVKLFAEKEVYPDIVIIDSDNELVDTRQLIKQLQGLNPTVAVLVLGSKGGPMSAVQALQAGAADYMRKPLDLDEVVARVERHVQRQHCIKLEMEKALEDAKQMMQQLMPASLLGDVMLRKDGASGAGGQKAVSAGGLNSVAETDFEDQMSELSEENHRLGQKVQEMERKLELKDKENRDLEAKLNAIDRRVAELASRSEAAEQRETGRDLSLGLGLSGSTSTLLLGQLGGQIRGQLDSVTQANLDLRHKVDELERMLHSQAAASQQAQQAQQAQQQSGAQPQLAPMVLTTSSQAPPPLPQTAGLGGAAASLAGSSSSGSSGDGCAAAAGATAAAATGPAGSPWQCSVGKGCGDLTPAAAAAAAEGEPPAPMPPPPQQHQPVELRASTSGAALPAAAVLFGTAAALPVSGSDGRIDFRGLPPGGSIDTPTACALSGLVSVQMLAPVSETAEGEKARAAGALAAGATARISADLASSRADGAKGEGGEVEGAAMVAVASAAVGGGGGLGGVGAAADGGADAACEI